MMKACEVERNLVWDWVRPEIVSIQLETTLLKALERMRQFGIHHLVVMNGHEFVGMFEARDIIRCSNLKSHVKEFMRRDAPTIDEETDVRTAVKLMLSGNISAIPLLRNGKINTVITESDLLRLLNVTLKQNKIQRAIEKVETSLAKPLLQALMEIMGTAGI